MKAKLSKLLKKPIDFLAYPGDRNYYNHLYHLFTILGFLTAIAIRLYFLQFESLDFQGFLDPWYQFIQQNGRFFALKHEFSNYNPTYLYLMVIVSYLFPNLSSLYAVKLISITFDFISAILVYKIIAIKYPNTRLPLLATMIFLLIPTVFINSAQWGQADGIYTAPLLASLYGILTHRIILALICFGLACSVKQQAIFFAPVILILWLKGKVKGRSLWIVPIVYLGMLVPAWIAGRPFRDLLTIYLKQAGTYQDLTKSAANIYQWVSGDFYTIAVPLGFGFTAVIMSLLVARVTRSPLSLNPDLIIQIAFLSCLLMPYCLPKMHERYFYPADVLSLIFCFYFSRYWLVPILVIYTSLFSYMIFLLDKRMVSMQVLSLVMTGVIITLLRHLDRQLKA